MIIRRDALILVADGRRYLLLRNRGDLNAPKLVYEGSGQKENPPTASQGSDRPGRAFESTGAMRSAVEQTDFHQLEEDRFAATVAEMLDRLARAGDFSELVVVAPPRCLAELRAHYTRPVSAALVAEVAKDLTRHPVSEIAGILGREGEEAA